MNNIVISILGTRLDHGGFGKRRWSSWRPSVSLLKQDDFSVDQFILIHHADEIDLAKLTQRDMQLLSPHTEVILYEVDFDDPWDFEQVYAALHDFALAQPFDDEQFNYYVHITTGTHVVQICLYLLTEANYLPGKLIQTAPNPKGTNGDGRDKSKGSYYVIDLDLSRYDQIASRFEHESREGIDYLKDGIETHNKAFNELITQIEQVSIRSTEPMLLTGPTGAGKSRLAKRIYELKKRRGQLKGGLVEVNCATLRGDNAMSALFGHCKGAFTGAIQERLGLLREADKGLLFLDEIAELGQDEQAMLLRAIEDKTFMPFGSDKQASSDFQLIAGTNKNLFQQVQLGEFREDLLARINVWMYEMPSLKERIEDLEPNIDHELEMYTRKAKHKVSFNKAAKKHYLQFAHSGEALWRANFRDLNSSITRMSTLASGGRINELVVEGEIKRLRYDWQSYPDSSTVGNDKDLLRELLDEDVLDSMDEFDQLQLAQVINVCRQHKSLAEAGRALFNKSRLAKANVNDSHRLRLYLKKFGLGFKDL